MIVVLVLCRRVVALRIVALSRIVAVGRVVAVIVIAGAGLGVGRVAAVIAGGSARTAIPAAVAVLRLRQAVVGLLDADAVPGFGVGWELEARVAQHTVGDQLRGTLPALGIALGPACVVLERASQDYTADRGLDEVRICVGDPLGRVADLLAVARERLATGVGADRQPQREASEEGLVAEQRRHAVADAACGFPGGRGETSGCLPMCRPGVAEIPRELLHERVGVALHLAPHVRVELRRRAERVRIGMGNPVLHVLAEPSQAVRPRIC